MLNLPTNLPNVSHARLPATYEAAKHALAECSRIDECQEWADKAEALASYARQAEDDQLRKLADRIQARAIRRCAELLKQFPTGHGGDRKSDQVDGSGNLISQRRAAAVAGMSDRQYRTALAVGAIPEAEFEREVESETPPTITTLAEHGRKTLLDLGSTAPEDFKMATAALASLRRFAEFTQTHDPQRVAAGVRPQEVAAVRSHVAAIDSWLDRFIVSIGG